MKAAEAILAAGLATLLAGCVLRGTPKAAQSAPAPPKPVVAAAPARPSGPLSIPQTQVELPPPQPISPEALATTEPPPEEPAPVPVAPKPTRSRAAQPARTDTPAAAPTVQAAPSEPAERPPVAEILSAEEQRQFLANAQHDRQEALRLLERASGRHLNGSQQNNKKMIESFLQVSTEEEKKGDLRQARELAARALLLAKELQP